MKNYKNNDKNNDKQGTYQHNSEETLYSLGIKPLRELLERSPNRIEWVRISKRKKNADTDRILDLCKEHSIRFELIDDMSFSKKFPKEKANNQGVIAKLKEVETITFEDMLIQATDAPLPLIVALDSVQDPGNVGTLARTLYALGGAGIVMPIHNSASLSIGAKKSSAGALDLLPVTRVTNLARALETADQAGYNLYSTALFQEDSPYGKQNILNPLSDKLEFPAVLVLGGEEKGVRPLVHSKCHSSLLIPMLRDFNSLNVAQAGAILISCFLKYRQ